MEISAVTDSLSLSPSFIGRQTSLFASSRLSVWFFVLCLFGLSSVCCPLSALAQAPLIVVITDNLTVEDLINPEASQLLAMARQGAISNVNASDKRARDFSAQGLPGLPLREISLANDPAALLEVAHRVSHTPASLTLLRFPISVADRVHSMRRLNILLYALYAERPEADLMIFSPQPVLRGKTLGFVLATGTSFPPGLFVSASTRTPGLITNSDLRAFLYARFSLADPQKIGGHILHFAEEKSTGEERVAQVRQSAYVAELNGRALQSVMPVIFGVIALFIFALIGFRRSWLKIGILFALNVPAALLFAPLFPPPTLPEYGGRIGAYLVGLSVIALLCERKLRVSAPLVCGFLLGAPVTLDLLCGQPLLKGSLLSGYPLSGIRFYGIGNEYLGAIVGFLLLWFLHNRKTENSDRLSRSLIFFALLLAVLFGSPTIGANAGSVIISTVGIGSTLFVLRGKTISPKRWLALALLGVALAFLVSAIEAKLFASEASHLGSAMQTAGGGGGVLSLVTIAVRKVGMNLRLFLSPFFLFAVGLGCGAVFLTTRRLREEIILFLTEHPTVRTRFSVVTATATATLLFKDSGVVSVAFLLMTVLLGLLWEMTPQKNKP
ncbi:MAG: hypothetical protein H7308_17785 [Chthonomonadaceae bacterium]|nr:hypothetical protein [Chthonomonadaceae bacterium]